MLVSFRSELEHRALPYAGESLAETLQYVLRMSEASNYAVPSNFNFRFFRADGKIKMGQNSHGACSLSQH